MALIRLSIAFLDGFEYMPRRIAFLSFFARLKTSFKYAVLFSTDDSLLSSSKSTFYNISVYCFMFYSVRAF